MKNSAYILAVLQDNESAKLYDMRLCEEHMRGVISGHYKDMSVRSARAKYEIAKARYEKARKVCAEFEIVKGGEDDD